MLPAAAVAGARALGEACRACQGHACREGKAMRWRKADACSQRERIFSRRPFPFTRYRRHSLTELSRRCTPCHPSLHCYHLPLSTTGDGRCIAASHESAAAIGQSCGTASRRAQSPTSNPIGQPAISLANPVRASLCTAYSRIPNST